MINVHLSAYDDGGIYRKQQIALLNEILSLEKEKGNYVIVGGDFNQDIANTIGKFEGEQQRPDWVEEITIDEITPGYTFVADDSIGSCRAAEIPYKENVNYLLLILVQVKKIYCSKMKNQ